MMVGNNLKDSQLQQIVDKTILFADKDEDGKISFDEFCAVSILIGSMIINFALNGDDFQVVGNMDVHKKMTLENI